MISTAAVQKFIARVLGSFSRMFFVAYYYQQGSPYAVLCSETEGSSEKLNAFSMNGALLEIMLSFEGKTCSAY